MHFMTEHHIDFSRLKCCVTNNMTLYTADIANLTTLCDSYIVDASSFNTHKCAFTNV